MNPCMDAVLRSDFGAETLLGYLDAYAGTRLVQNVLPDPGVLGVLGEDVVANIYGIHEPPGLHVVEGKFVPCGGRGGMEDYTYLHPPED